MDEFLKFLKLPSNAVRQLPPTIAECEPKSRAAFPLGFGHASNYITKGVALVGYNVFSFKNVYLKKFNVIFYIL